MTFLHQRTVANINVIVVRAGIASFSTAWSLIKAGHGVTQLEQGAIPNPLAASGDHCVSRRRVARAVGDGDVEGLKRWLRAEQL